MHPFAEWTVEQLLSLMAGIVGVVMMVMAMRRDSQSDRDPAPEGDWTDEPSGESMPIDVLAWSA